MVGVPILTLKRVLMDFTFLMVFVRMIAINHVRRNIVMQEAGNSLDTNDTANETPSGSVSRCLRR